MNSIRARLLLALMALVASVSLMAAGVTYRRVLGETSELFDYQLRQMALSLRGQVSLAPRIEVPPDQGDQDFVVQIWDVFGTRTYLSRPGLPLINQVVLGYSNLSLAGGGWRAYGLQTPAGVIQIAQPLRVRESLARAAALRVAIPLMLLLPAMMAFVTWIVGSGLKPLRHLTAEVQSRDARSLRPVEARGLPDEIAPLANELNRLLARVDRAFAAQRDFIADAAHELRSPLTALRLQLQLLDRAPDADARSAAREWLGAAVERSIHLVEQLLTLARSDPSQHAPSPQPVDLAAVAMGAAVDSQVFADARGIELSVEAGAPVWLEGDAEGLRTLARNLVDNAVRYTPSGGTVKVCCRIVDGGARLSVTDSGPGIPAADRQRVFDRFHRQPAAGQNGTGLGLAIVKAIADRHSAAVALNDAPGGGLVASVTFPAAAARPVSVTGPASATEPASATGPASRPPPA